MRYSVSSPSWLLQSFVVVAGAYSLSPAAESLRRPSRREATPPGRRTSNEYQPFACKSPHDVKQNDIRVSFRCGDAWWSCPCTRYGQSTSEMCPIRGHAEGQDCLFKVFKMKSRSLRVPAERDVDGHFVDFSLVRQAVIAGVGQ